MEIICKLHHNSICTKLNLTITNLLLLDIFNSSLLFSKMLALISSISHLLILYNLTKTMSITITIADKVIHTIQD